MPKFEVTVIKEVSIVIEAPDRDAAMDFVNNYTDDIGNEDWGNNGGYDWQEDKFIDLPDDDDSKPDVVLDDVGNPEF